MFIINNYLFKNYNKLNNNNNLRNMSEPLSREDQIKILQQTCLSKVSRKNISYINSLKSAKIWKTLGVPIAGMSAGSDPFDDSGYEPPGGLLECKGFKRLNKMFSFPNTLKVMHSGGKIEDGWTLNCFHLFFMVDRNQ